MDGVLLVHFVLLLRYIGQVAMIVPKKDLTRCSNMAR